MKKIILISFLLVSASILFAQGKRYTVKGTGMPDLSTRNYPDDSTAFSNGIGQYQWYRTGNLPKYLTNIPDTSNTNFNYYVVSTGGNAYQTIRFNGWNGNFNVTANWGDGTTTARAGDSADYHLSHTYTGAGIFRPIFTFSDSSKVLQVHLSRMDSCTAINRTTFFPNAQEYDIAYTKLSSLDNITYPSTVLTIYITENYYLTEFNPSKPLPALTSLSITGNNIRPTGSGIFAAITGLTYPLPATLTAIDFSANNWTQAQVNATLVYLDGLTFNAGAKTLNITQYNAACTPSGAGLTAKTDLQSKGWTVTSD